MFRWRTYKSPICSACHPVGKNVNDSSRVLHWSVIWVNSPHEKHPSAESTDVSGEAASSSVTALTGNQFSNMVSKAVAGDCTRATGVGGDNTPISCWMRTSQSDGIGTAGGDGNTGVGNNFLMMCSLFPVSGNAAGAGSSSVTWQTTRAGHLSTLICGVLSTSR